MSLSISRIYVNEKEMDCILVKNKNRINFEDRLLYIVDRDHMLYVLQAREQTINSIRLLKKEFTKNKGGLLICS
jgi:hypothetical protein